MFLVCCLGILGRLMVTKKSRGFQDSPKIRFLERSPVHSVRNFWGTLKENLTFVQKLMDTFWSFASGWFALVAILLRRSLLVGTVLSSTPRVKSFFLVNCFVFVPNWKEINVKRPCCSLSNILRLKIAILDVYSQRFLIALSQNMCIHSCSQRLPAMSPLP